MQEKRRLAWTLLAALQCASACTGGTATDGSNAATTTGAATTAGSGSGSTAGSGSATGGGSPSTTGSTTNGGGLQTLTYQASTAAINNPERGFMKWADIVNNPDLSAIRAAGLSLGFAVVRLDDYRGGGDLPASFLQQINTGFANARAAHIKLVLRFSYNYPGTDPDGSATADAPLATIQKHASQLASTIASNIDVIAVMQTGFLGQWGEWHDSSSGLDDATDRLAVMNAVLAALPKSRYTLIRYPYEKRENWQGPLSAQTAAGSSDGARIGHHNDCFLDGQDEGGTFHSTDDMNYLAADTFYVPMGGETCASSSPWSDCTNATAELATYHWAFLNGDFDQDVLNGWQQQGCMAQITNKLGYRFTLHDAVLNTQTTASNPTLDLTVHLSNDGYARLFNARPVYVTLNGAGGRHDYALTDVNARSWDPNGSATIAANLPLGSIAAGTYTVALWLPDAATGLQGIADYAVQFANTGTWDSTSGYNVLTNAFVVQ